MARQIVLDTETTGLDPQDGHRLIEVGCIELVDRRLTGNQLHLYFYPDREVPEEAVQIHGITNDFLQGKPRFYECVDELMQFLQGAELIIHNAPFDLGFINHELASLRQNDWGSLQDHCSVLDTLVMARQKHPGQRNSLDALCKRYSINNAHRTLHGALLDSEILANVYLAMTGGQRSLFTDQAEQQEKASDQTGPVEVGDHNTHEYQVPIVSASEAELAAHQQYCDMLSSKLGEEVKW